MSLRKLFLLALVMTSARSLVAAPAATVTTLSVTSGTAAAPAVAAGTVVTLTATVKSGTALVRPGLVKFCDSSIQAHCEGSAQLGVAQIVSSTAKATLKVRLGLGVHSLTAEFVGTASYAKSVSAVSSLEVQGLAGSVTTLTATPTDATGSYALGATVSALGAGALGWPPTGTVTFPDAANGGKSLGSAALAAGSLGYGMNFVESWNNYGNVQAVGDFNGDGFVDFVAVYYSNGVGTSYVGLGDGAGAFTFFENLPALGTGSEYVGFSVADFNEDGVPDLLASISSANPSGPAILGFELLLGKGDGSFTAGTMYGATSANTLAIAPLVGDFNNDGLPDVIAYTSSQLGTNYIQSDFQFYAGLGGGGFAAPVDLGGGLLPSAVGDFNNDGKLDLIGPDLYRDAVVMLGNGNGTFQAPLVSTYANDTNYFGASSNGVIGDFNGDGILDLVGFDGVTAYISYGNGDGTFCNCNPVEVQLNPAGNGGSQLYSADLNGDGLPDLFQFPGTGGIYTYLNNGDGTFLSEPLAISGLAGQAQYLYAVADVNGDGLPDIFAEAGNDATSETPVLLNTGGWVSQAVLPSVTVAPGSGKHEVKAAFGGDAGTMASSSSENTPLWASKLTTAIAMTASATTIASGGTVKLTATLTPATSGSDTANGELVGFYSGSTLVGSAPLAAGVAMLTTGLPGGADSVTAVYPGDASFNGAASAPVKVTVTVKATTLALTTSSATATAYAAPGVTLTATLSPFNAGTTTTNGEKVSFLNGKTLLGTGVLTNGVATLVAELPVGSESITASYAGDESFAAANSAAKMVTVSKEAVSMAVGSAPAGPVGLYTPVTLTATITAANAAGYPNLQSEMQQEAIYFYYGSELLGWEYIQPGTVAGTATASVTTYGLPLGTDKVTAVYSGDVNFSASTGTETLTVVKNATTLTLALVNSCASESCTFVYPGDTVTLAATLSGYNFQYSTPGGEFVKFYNGSTLLGTGQLVYGYQAGCASTTQPCATFTTSSLPAGTVNLKAVYAGDAEFLAETSNTLPAVVGPEGTKTTLTASSTTAAAGTQVQLTADVSSLLAGDTFFDNFAYSSDTVSFYDANGTKLLGTLGIQTSDGTGGLEAVFTTNSLPVGSNVVSAVYGGDAAYKGSKSTTVTVTVTAATTAGIVWAEPEPVMEGTPLSEKQLDASAQVEGLLAYSPKMGTVLPRGKHTLTAQFTPSAAAAAAGYRASTKAVTLVVK